MRTKDFKYIEILKNNEYYRSFDLLEPATIEIDNNDPEYNYLGINGEYYTCDGCSMNIHNDVYIEDLNNRYIEAIKNEFPDFNLVDRHKSYHDNHEEYKKIFVETIKLFKTTSIAKIAKQLKVSENLLCFIIENEMDNNIAYILPNDLKSKGFTIQELSKLGVN